MKKKVKHEIFSLRSTKGLHPGLDLTNRPLSILAIANSFVGSSCEQEFGQDTFDRIISR